jgi:hypothetical protein
LESSCSRLDTLPRFCSKFARDTCSPCGWPPAKLVNELLKQSARRILARQAEAVENLRDRVLERSWDASTTDKSSVVSLNYGTVFAPGLIRPLFQGESIPCDVRLLFK